MREWLPGLCRAGWQHGTAGQGSRAQDSQYAAAARARGSGGHGDQVRVSSLKDRLREIIKPSSSDVLPRRLDTNAPPGAVADLERVLDGRWEGERFVVERHMPPSSRCGRATIGDLATR